MLVSKAMFKASVLSLGLILGMATTGQAAMTPFGVDAGSRAVERVAEGCGAGSWRDQWGHCHHFDTSRGSLRGTHFACPPGTHIGRYGHKCWNN